MAQYINKDALVAEIESKFQKYWKRGEESDTLQDGNAKYWGGVLSCLNEVKTLIDSIEVKEVESMQENPCNGCTNRKGCITCENGELRETVQEEPVSVWHDSNKEQPNFASAVAIWNPKYENGEILSRCTEVYSDRIWAYIDDLLKM